MKKTEKPIQPSYKMGNVDDGTTVTDWMPDERRRGISITAACVTCYWRLKEPCNTEKK